MAMNEEERKQAEGIMSMYHLGKSGASRLDFPKQLGSLEDFHLLCNMKGVEIEMAALREAVHIARSIPQDIVNELAINGLTYTHVRWLARIKPSERPHCIQHVMDDRPSKFDFLDNLMDNPEILIVNTGQLERLSHELLTIKKGGTSS